MSNLPEEELAYKDDVLQVIFNESKDLRSQQLSQLLQISEHMWGSLNFSMILLGIYISSCLFLCTPGNLPSKPASIIGIPLLLSILYIIIAIALCISAVFPTDMFNTPHENSIYELLIEEKKKVLKALTDTYFIGYRDIRIKVQERNSLRKEVIILTLASVIEFIFFALTFFLKKQITIIITTSIIFFIIFEIFLIKFLEDENKRINLLREE